MCNKKKPEAMGNNYGHTEKETRNNNLNPEEMSNNKITWLKNRFSKTKQWFLQQPVHKKILITISGGVFGYGLYYYGPVIGSSIGSILAAFSKTDVMESGEMDEDTGFSDDIGSVEFRISDNVNEDSSFKPNETETETEIQTPDDDVSKSKEIIDNQKENLASLEPHDPKDPTEKS
uniref:Uncharacterized protein n=1 Tax=Blidingia minima TaxID=63414 RepID=A0A8E5N6Q2_9CHLO|nr:hypothetical protein [Blidingia minima]